MSRIIEPAYRKNGGYRLGTSAEAITLWVPKTRLALLDQAFCSRAVGDWGCMASPAHEAEFPSSRQDATDQWPDLNRCIIRPS